MKPLSTKIIKLSIAVTILFLFNGCTAVKNLSENKPVRISILAGINKGGITENTDMSVVPGVSVPAEATVDAFSGSTGTGFNASVHFAQELGRAEIETGIDLMHNYQLFNYIDAGNFYIGVRRIDLTQIMVPLTLNFPVLKEELSGIDLKFKVGLLGQTNFIRTLDTGIRLPGYTCNQTSMGVTAGFASFPVRFEDGSKLGIYVDIYRGSIIYEDFYNRSSFEMPGSSFVKVGLQYQFK